MRAIYCTETQERIPPEYFHERKAIWCKGKPYLTRAAIELNLKPDPQPPPEFAELTYKPKALKMPPGYQQPPQAAPAPVAPKAEKKDAQLYCAETNERIPPEYFSERKAVWCNGKPYLVPVARRLRLMPDASPPPQYAHLRFGQPPPVSPAPAAPPAPAPVAQAPKPAPPPPPPPPPVAPVAPPRPPPVSVDSHETFIGTPQQPIPPSVAAVAASMKMPVPPIAQVPPPPQEPLPPAAALSGSANPANTASPGASRGKLQTGQFKKLEAAAAALEAAAKTKQAVAKAISAKDTGEYKALPPQKKTFEEPPATKSAAELKAINDAAAAPPAVDAKPEAPAVPPRPENELPANAPILQAHTPSLVSMRGVSEALRAASAELAAPKPAEPPPSPPAPPPLPAPPEPPPVKIAFRSSSKNASVTGILTPEEKHTPAPGASGAMKHVVSPIDTPAPIAGVVSAPPPPPAPVETPAMRVQEPPAPATEEKPTAHAATSVDVDSGILKPEDESRRAPSASGERKQVVSPIDTPEPMPAVKDEPPEASQASAPPPAPVAPVANEKPPEALPKPVEAPVAPPPPAPPEPPSLPPPEKKILPSSAKHASVTGMLTPEAVEERSLLPSSGKLKQVVPTADTLVPPKQPPVEPTPTPPPSDAAATAPENTPTVKSLELALAARKAAEQPDGGPVVFSLKQVAEGEIDAGQGIRVAPLPLSPAKGKTRSPADISTMRAPAQISIRKSKTELKKKPPAKPPEQPSGKPEANEPAPPPKEKPAEAKAAPPAEKPPAVPKKDPAPPRVLAEAHLDRGEKLTAAALMNLEIFQGIPPGTIERLPGAIVKRRFKKGEVICREGEYGSTAFYLLEGHCSVSIHAPISHVKSIKLENARSGLFGIFRKFSHMLAQRTEEDPGTKFIPTDGPMDLSLQKPLGTLGPTDLFGEMTCKSFYPRSATVVADTDCVMLEMLRNVLQVLMKNKKFKEKLEKNYRDRALAQHLRSVPAFSRVDDEFIKQLKSRVELVEYEPGDVIIKQGDLADAFYLIRVGCVKVSRSYWGVEDLVLTYLSRGEYFGEMALLKGGVRTATCTALDHLEVVKIAKHDFEFMMGWYDGLRERFLKEAERRESAGRALLEHAPALPLDEFLGQGLMQAQSLLLLDLEKCTRCDECVRACADSHDGVTRLVREGLRFDKYLVPTSCRSCMDPVCMIGCPVGSIRRKESLEIIIEDWCIGCGICAKQCPYGNITMHPFDVEVPDPHNNGIKRAEVREKAVTCDLCTELNEPSCVYACPHDAALRVNARKFFLDQTGTGKKS